MRPESSIEIPRFARGVWPYVAAVTLSLVFVTVRLGMEPILKGQAPLIALLAAPLLTCWYFGFRPALVATLLCAGLGELLFVQPSLRIGAVNAAEALRLFIFVTYGIVFSWLIETRRALFMRLLRERVELQQAKDQIAQREARLRDVLEAAPAGMLVVNQDGAIEMANAHASAMFGYTQDELAGLHVERLTPDAHRAVHSGDRRRYQAEPTSRPMGIGRDLHAQRKDGSVFPVEIGLNPLQGGSAGLTLASVADITRRKAAEDSLRSSEQQALNLARQAREAEETLREADRRKDEFIAVLAHELRNPLAPVRNAVEILKRLGPPDPKLQRARDIIARQVGHMARLIDDLLDVSRITRGQLDLQREPCDLAAIMRETAEDYRALIEAEGQQLQLQISDQPLHVDGDPTRLAQMLGNVLTNAVRFNQPPGRIEVDVAQRDAHACITVTDTGVGIDAELLTRLFDPFAQAAQDIARVKGGLGLGLALTKGLADLHGGTVAAESDGPGRGARFTIAIPLAQANDVLDTAVPLTGPAASRPGLHILLVEDNHDTASSMAELLQLMGHQVRLAFTGQDGIDMARRTRPDVVLSDLGLPGAVDGFALGRTLRAEPALANTRLIALSGYADEQARRKCMAAGYDDHIAKPPNLAELESVLARIEPLNRTSPGSAV
jgi:PAS domain S-box-containing protein